MERPIRTRCYVKGNRSISGNFESNTRKGYTLWDIHSRDGMIIKETVLAENVPLSHVSQERHKENVWETKYLRHRLYGKPAGYDL